MAIAKFFPYKLQLKTQKKLLERNNKAFVWMGADGSRGEGCSVFLPVLLQGHQEPGELAAHSPSSWHLDPLPFALGGAQHPTG